MFDVYVPATSANCCVGFDSLGMAVDWWSHFRFDKSDVLKISGCPEEYQGEDNLVVQAFYKTCDYLHQEYPVFSLVIDSDIPFARGLGSSSTCVVAGILACDAWFDANLTKEEVLEIATSMEGHPDNVAPAIFGQATACFMKDGKVHKVDMPCGDFVCLAMVPDYPVKTSDARKVLPSSLDYFDAVGQVGHALVFSRALQEGNEKLLCESCQDILHEPYRKQFIQEYDKIKEICMGLEIPMWISGSGSTMLALAKSNDKLHILADAIQDLRLDLRFVSIAKRGAFVQ